MKTLSLACVVAALAAAVLSPLSAQSNPWTGTERLPATPPLAGHDEGPIPGARPGTERWIVHFAARSFDLDGFRTAVLERRSAAEVAGIVADLEGRVRADQAAFVADVERLGGTVLAQWWIVNACAVEVPPGAVAGLRAHENVSRLEADRYAQAGIGGSINALNHNAVAVHARGYRGAGATVAIMDTGADEVMGSANRPHRLYFVNGDPTNTSGGGIGGSRLVVNHQAGLLPPEDINGHGTAVAAVAAGGAWGTVGSSHGHAYDAQIASYAIADQANGNSSQASMVNGWQAIAAQRVARGIVAANNSYQGGVLSDPVSAVQQALDSTAYNADVLVSVIAGNRADGGLGQSGCNALVVAAVSRDVHAVADWSGHGPKLGDPQRFWPDLAAAGVDVRGPAIDCEGNNFKWSGTSFAGPQVAGAAALLRSAVTSLRADETKALLLASAMDIADRNPNPPHNSRNAYGMGLLRDDVALDAALHAARRRGWSTMQAASPRMTFPVTLTGGVEHGIAITWHRTTMTHTNWSNLDLRILDAANAVVASSTTPRNLYEMVRYRPAQTGPFTIEVTGVSLDGTAQEFAYAVAESLAVPPIAATYTSFGLGCAGSGDTGVSGPVCTSATTWATTPSFGGLGEGSEFAILESSPGSGPITIQGLSFLTAAPPGLRISWPVAIYAADAQNRPTGSPLATGAVNIGSAPGWWGGVLTTPVTFPPNTFFFVAFQTPMPAGYAPVPEGTAGEYRLLYWRGACTTTWQAPFQNQIAYRAHCTGTSGPGAVPSLWNEGLPSPGATFRAHLEQARPSAAAVLLTGTSRTAWGAVTLPASLAAYGAAGCSALVSGDIATSVNTDAVGRADVPFAIPPVADLLGSRVYQQYAVLDTVNALGLVTSNGGEARIGLLP